MTQPGPTSPQNSLQDLNDVEFQWADDLEPGSGYTPQEVDALLDVPLDDVLTASATGNRETEPNTTESLYSSTGEGGDQVPWKVMKGHNCPDGKPYAVVKISDGSVAGCHDSESSAQAQLRALYANENETTVVTPESFDVKLSAEAYGSDRGLREYWTHGEGALKIRWGTPGDFNRCVRHLGKYVRDPEGLCNEYHTEAVGAPPGKGHSVETQSFDVKTAGAPVARVGSDNPRSIGWEGLLAMEGEETGDGREFANGSLEWGTPPLPLMYQYETSHGGTTDRSTNVGNITEIWRDGSKIMGRGTIDLDDEYGMQAARKMKGKYLNGVSIDADGVKQDDIELVYAPADPELSADEALLQMMGATPDKTIFHRGRIRGATLVNLPAFINASLELIGDTSVLDTGMTASAKLGIFKKSKKGGDREYVRDANGRFDDVPGVGEDKPKSIFDYPEDSPEWQRYKKWVEGDTDRTDGGGQSSETRKLNNVGNYDEADDDMGASPDPYREPEPDDDAGMPLPTDYDKRRKKRFTPNPDSDYSVITASASNGRRGYTIEIPELPPLEFFQEPTELPPIGAVWIDANGHISGLIGPSDTPHRAFKGKRVTIPMGNVDYTRWMNRPTLAIGSNGEVLKIRTGVITMNCGHLNPYAASDPAERMKHYDNSCSIAAVVRVGESRKHRAPWMSGVIMPMSVADFQRFQACQISGDWSPSRQKRGWKEFVAALAVPVPGFARSTDVPAIRVDDNSVVVASTVPIRLTADAYLAYTDEPSVTSHRAELAQIRARVAGSSRNRQTLAAIRQRVTAGSSPVVAAAATVTPPKETKVGCAPCAAKRAARAAQQQTSAQITPPVEGFGTGDQQEIDARSQSNSIANSRATSRG